LAGGGRGLDLFLRQSAQLRRRACDGGAVCLCALDGCGRGRRALEDDAGRVDPLVAAWAGHEARRDRVAAPLAHKRELALPPVPADLLRLQHTLNLLMQQHSCNVTDGRDEPRRQPAHDHPKDEAERAEGGRVHKCPRNRR